MFRSPRVLRVFAPYQGKGTGETNLLQCPNKPHGRTGEQYRRYPKTLMMRQVTVDARDMNNRVKQFKVVTTILDPVRSKYSNDTDAP